MWTTRPPCVTFAIADDVPVGVVIVAYTSRLSRMYRWDLSTDQFEGGQWVRARAFVLDISPDGNYVGYFAAAFHRREISYLAVSHVPYFTALLFKISGHLGWNDVRFVGQRIHVLTSCIGWASTSKVRNRVEPGCPMQIVKDLVPTRLGRTRKSVEDKERGRTVFSNGESLFEVKAGEEPRLIATFPREEFQEVPPPDWAGRW